MPRDYADIKALVLAKLQDVNSAEFGLSSNTGEINYQIEECLKESALSPHIVPIIFKIESRTGKDTAGTASSLTDTDESQFVATDDDNEKVIHNISDDTWAVVLTYTSTSVLVLTADIMDSGESYEIYNKRCWNQRQIYIGDVQNYLDIDSVEYPIGTKRNWKVYNDVLEIDVASVEDSDTTQTYLPNVEVLVRFIKPHILSQLTDWAGVLTAAAAAEATTIAVGSLGTTEVVEEGEEFYLANQKTLYTVTADVTMNSGAGTLAIYPSLEAAAVNQDGINFVKSSLTQEEEFADLVASRLAINKAPKFFNAISLGGGAVWRNYLDWGERRLSEVLSKLRRGTPPKTKRRYTPY